MRSGLLTKIRFYGVEIQQYNQMLVERKYNNCGIGEIAKAV